MYIDIKGNKRQKVGLHMHTSVSDGKLSPEETARAYKSQGYDAIALTDHWTFGEYGNFEGMTVNIRELLQLYLEKDGYAVTVAADGGQGLEKFRAIKP
ncbi:MAG: hypothetical protein IIX25_03420, partial [Clostridia bacterium]|nr:hypothetical protein [Clostridia bacterium]